ncbi:hypothetical protein FNAPI_4593 [Neofusicoccum parvum]|uniref:Uncharacterized protein n=1 Tax=Neofusicoccum parvum TaxID=310453 RepID=A0ACB5S1J6_9PEZI|nr:hypothetical protein FNAPI_4593 [Neofusicoccum parvum]
MLMPYSLHFAVANISHTLSEQQHGIDFVKFMEPTQSQRLVNYRVATHVLVHQVHLFIPPHYRKAVHTRKRYAIQAEADVDEALSLSVSTLLDLDVKHLERPKQYGVLGREGGRREARG